MRLLTAVSATVFAFALHGAPLPLSNERPIGPITPAAAAAYQSDPSIAVDSSGHAVAIWRDQRLLSAACTQCSAIYGSRLDSAGQPLDRFGKLIAIGGLSGEIASAGNDFLVVFGRMDGLSAQRFDADLQPVGSATLIAGAGSYVAALASNGRTYLALVQNVDRLQAYILDTRGEPIATSNFPSMSGTSFAKARIVVSGSQYHVLRQNSSCSRGTCTSSIEDVVVDDQAGQTSRILETAPGQLFQIGATASDQGLLIAWATDVPGTGTVQETVEYEFFRNDGTSSGRRTAYSLAVSSASAGNQPVVVWDGRQFALLFQVGAGAQMVGVRIDAAGTQIDPTPLVVHSSNPPSSYPMGISSARLPNGSNLIVWSDGSDVWNVAVRSTNEIFNSSGQLVTYSGTEQRDLQVAGANAIWIESASNKASIVAAINDGAPVTIAPMDSVWLRQSPAIASNDKLTLVAWMESSPRTRIYARRLDATGTILDLDPILVADEPEASGSVAYFHRALSIASDGARFFVSWPTGSEVHGRTIGSEGVPAGTVPIVVAKFDPNHDSPYITRTVWTGAQWIVATTRTRTSGLLIAPAPFDDSIYLARVTSDGVPLDASTPTLVYDAGFTSAPVAAAFSSGRLMLVWRRIEASSLSPSASLWMQLFDSDGKSLQPSPQQLVPGQSGTLLDADVASFGKSFVVGTSERSGPGRYFVVGRLVDLDGQVVGDSFDLSSAVADATSLALSGTAGLTVGYTRKDTEAGDVMRGFMRGMNVPPRRRATH